MNITCDDEPARRHRRNQWAPIQAFAHLGRRVAVGARDTSGTTAVEFALVIPVVITIIVGALVLGYYFFVFNEIEDIATQTSRYVAVNDPSSAELDSYVAGKLSASTLSATNYAVTSVTETIEGVDFTVVTLTYNFSLISRSVSEFLGFGSEAMSYTAVSRSPIMQ